MFKNFWCYFGVVSCYLHRASNPKSRYLADSNVNVGSRGSMGISDHLFDRADGCLDRPMLGRGGCTRRGCMRRGGCRQGRGRGGGGGGVGGWGEGGGEA